MCVGFLSLIFVAALVAAQQPVPVTLNIVDHPTVITNAATALGGAIDGHEKGDAKKNLSSKSVKKMLQAGLKPLAYRLRTELGVEAWHWNPVGTWSDKKNNQGYWSSSIALLEPIEASYGYRLPRRGDTLDEANNDGYSRLDDGNANTFWKSNPYLTSYYTGESDEQHPQWVVLDFGKPVLINAARLHWREPFAKKFKIQYATGGDLYFGHNKAWHDFPHGKISDSRGGSPLLDLGVPRLAQYVRILMTEGSGTAPFGSTDPRDHMGYALQEVEVGFLKEGIFQDHVIHRPDQKQTMVTVSSTDPWHRASDLDEKTEQPGIDAVATSRLGNNQPILWSLPVLYDTPENAAALVSYLKKRNYLKPHQRIELGEEPDGQHVDPKDFGELYSQVAEKIQNLQPAICNLQPVLGGLSFVTIDCQPKDTTYRFDHRRWLRPFLKQLRHHHREKDFQFLTFEWYPFDELLLPAPELLRSNVGSLRRAMNMMWSGGVPKSMPLLITEYGYSVFSGEPEVKMEAALLNAEIASEFLLARGTTAYLYGYEPNTLECGINNSWGNMMMLLECGEHLIPLPTFYGAQMVSECVKEKTKLFPVKSSQRDLAAYAFHQQNSDQWTFLCINKNPTKSYQLVLGNQFSVEKTSYSSKNYQWHADGPNGFPSKNEPPQHELISAGAPVVIEPWALTILKTKKPGRLSRALKN
ncbi:MAG: discoidin domain-containing protein [Chthoniobacterales bacterium]|nr:discoidin domain-containing protein [Chthoniobacterales bacterium]